MKKCNNFISCIVKQSIMIGVLFIFCSCEKVINIDLNKADPKIVVEAEISDQSFCKVKLIQTVNFDESNTFPPVTGAVIKISDNFGNSETLTETSQGVYIGITLQGMAGRIYTLEIKTGAKTYTAVSAMSKPVSIDTLVVEKLVGHVSGKMIQAQYTDPTGIANFYRFILFINNDREYILLDDDRLQDGEVIKLPLFSPNPPKGLSSITGDSVTVYVQAIDKGVYEYFRTLNQLSSGGPHGGSAPPANPQTNIDNGALGYFSAYAIKSKSIIVN